MRGFLHKEVVFVLFFLVFFSLKTIGQTTTSGEYYTWSTAGAWSPSAVPASTTNVTVNNPLTLDQNLVIGTGSYTFNQDVTDQPGGTNYNFSAVNASGSLIVASGTTTIGGVTNIGGNSVFTLTVKSGATLVLGTFGSTSDNFLIGNKVNINIELGGTIIVYGNIVNSNSTGTFSVNGLLQVYGDYKTDNGNIDINGTGQFYTTGAMQTQGASSTIYGSSNDCTSNCSGTSLGCGTSGSSYTATITPQNQTICSGTSVAGLTFTTNAPSPTYQWEYSLSAGGGYTTISGATSNTYTPSPLTVTTWYRVKYTSSASGCGTKYSAPIPVYVSASTYTQSTAGQTVCSGSFGPISVSAHGTGLTYQWYSNISALNSGGTIISGATLNVYTPSNAISGTRYYYCVINSSCGTAFTTAISGAFTSNLNTVGTASSIPTLCVNTLLSTITHTTTGATGIGTATGLPTGVSASWSSNIISINGTPTVSGTFNYSIPLTGGCGTVNAVGTITVNGLSTAPTGITGAATICNGNSTTLTVNGGSLGTGAIVEWFTGSCGGTSAGTGNSITVSPTSNTTYYVRYSGTCNTTTCASQLVTVNTLSIAPTGISGTTTICNGNSTTLTVNGGTLGTGAIVEWFTGSCGGTSAGTGNSITVSPTSNTTYYVRYIGTCNTTTCASQLVTVNALPNNITNGFSATTICAGGSPQLTFDADDSTFTTPYSITYMNDTTLLQYTVAISSASPYSFTPADNPTSNTGYTLVSISNATCTSTTAFMDSGANLIVRPIPIVMISGTTSMCVGASSPNVVFSNPQTVAVTATYTINGGANQTINIAATSSSNIAVATTAAGVFVYDLVSVVYQSSPTCSNVLSGSATVTVNPNLPASVSIAASPSGAICAGTSVSFTATPTNGGGSPAYQWQVNGSNVGTGVTYTTTTLANNDVVTVVMTSNASPCLTGSPATSNGITMIVNSVPVAPIVGTITQPTCTVDTGSVVLNGLPSSGTWTLVRSGTSSATTTGTGTSTTISGLTDGGSYFFTVSNGTCTSSLSSSVVINSIATTTSTWNGSAWVNGVPDSSRRIVFSGNFSSTANVVGCSCKVTGGANVVINSAHTLTITNSVDVISGSLTFENNASLVQINDAAVNSGNINYKRYTTAVRRYDFTYWSSPVVGQTLKNLSPNTFYDKFYGYNPNSGWVIYYYGNKVMLAGEGYAVRAPQSFSLTVAAVDTNPMFIGVPNNGIVNLALTANKTYLLGNPYPSAINADTFLDANTSVLEGTLYFWTHNSSPSSAVVGDATYNYTSDDYATYNRTGGVSTSKQAVTGGALPSGKIAAGQGFFAPSSTAGGTLVFNNAMRISGGASGVNNSQFFKLNTGSKSNVAVTSTTDKNRIWLNLTNAEGAFKQTLIGYIAGATNNYDAGFDGVTYDGNKFVDFYSVNQSVNLSIQGRALPFVKNDTVVLGYKSAIKGDFQISIDHADGILATQNVFLEDKDLQVLYNLTSTSYTFSTEKGVFNNRFVLHYVDKNAVEEIETTSSVLNSGLVVSVQDNDIKISSSVDLISGINIYNVLGQLIYKKEKMVTNDFVIQHLNIAHQVLIVNVVLANNQAVSTKIVY